MADSTQMNKDEFDAAFPPGSEMRREEEVRNPRPEDEGQSSADMTPADVEEFRAWQASRSKPVSGEVPEDQWKAPSSG